MARADLPESVLNQFIDEEALGVCFELHRAIKLGYYELLYPEDRYYYERLTQTRFCVEDVFRLLYTRC